MLPPAIAKLADVLATMPGAVAVVLGGSRAAGTASASSDWDLGVYYRGPLDTSALAPFGTVHPPGSWGRIMNGGAWLQIEGTKVDVLLRDLDVVDHWTARAQEGDFEIDALLGYVAGVPTYSLMAERAVARVVHGDLPEVGGYPSRLADKATQRWRFSSDFTLTYARMQAAKGDVIGTVGQATKAVLEAAHARMCASSRWILNEKGLISAAGLSGIQASFLAIPREPDGLTSWIDRLRSDLDRET
ncbi:MAG TPA: nucleotidyltransferase domain-containing protein [Thermoanaerobaculia bacterium]|nr:nucleotidyltransferase domain-containing protein [Thermoanaerobaculia bacterium]